MPFHVTDSIAPGVRMCQQRANEMQLASFDLLGPIFKCVQQIVGQNNRLMGTF